LFSKRQEVLSKLSHYDQLLEELRNRARKLASEYIPKLYRALRDEYHFTPEQSRTKIERDCGDIWAADTIRKYLPAETKSLAKRKAGKISADVKKSKKKRAEHKLLVANATDSVQYSAVLNQGGDCENYEEDPVGMNPTENIPVAPAKKESSISQVAEEVWDEDSLHPSLVDNRLSDEAFEENENLLLAGDIVESSNLLLPSKMAEQIYNYVKAALESKIIPDFKLEHNGVRVISVRRCSEIKN